MMKNNKKVPKNIGKHTVKWGEVDKRGKVDRN